MRIARTALTNTPPRWRKSSIAPSASVRAVVPGLSLSNSLGEDASVIGVEVSSFMVEVQIVRVEHGCVHQAIQIEDVKLFALQLDQAVAAKLLKRPVHVDSGQSRSIGKIVLGQREIAAPVLRSPDGP